MQRTCFILSLLFAVAIASAQSAKPLPAQDILNTAFKQAESTNRNIFVIFHASWCVWCKRLDAALENPLVKEIIEQSYVVTHLDVLERKEKIESLENPGGVQILKNLGGDSAGLPFYAFLDAKGKRIANSNVMPQRQNIGYPGSKEEIEAFIALLKQTAKHMSDDQRVQIMNHFETIAPKPRLASDAVGTNKDAIINDLNNLAVYTYQYRIRSSAMGGGGGSFVGFAIPKSMTPNANAKFQAEVIDADHVQIKATSEKGFGWISTMLDADGRFSDWKFGEKFQ